MEAARVYVAVARQNRRELGQCQECTEPAIEGQRRCVRHTEKLRLRQQACGCGHFRYQHKHAGCRACDCREFVKRQPPTDAERIERLKPYWTPEHSARARAKAVEATERRWAEKYPGVPIDDARRIYREGYQAGHQQARTAHNGRKAGSSHA